MRASPEFMTLIVEWFSVKLDIAFKTNDIEKHREQENALRNQVVTSFGEYDRACELIERVMTEHWDIGSCPCTFCQEGRKLGLKPQSRYPTTPAVSILYDGSKEQKLPQYDWTQIDDEN